ncbi:MAG: gliding motility-associated ABC transporter ATP-binding subunit GldA [Bacteroidia bacterium]|nr:gliding motility-associated ABC transporter ATP-binding subunit GldA [Bacteroidia bacterium]
MVSVQGLTKIYGEQKAVNDLSFEVKKGEILGFLGPNGAGKSTTMKIITGYLEATEGMVEVDGFDVSSNPLEVKKRVGYLPEHNPLYLDMYVHEFLDFASRIHGLEKKLRKSRIEEVIEMTGLHVEQHKKIGALSKGYRQRVGISQALIHDPEVLILDEPTSGLDPNQIIDIRQLVREVGKDKTVIFSSHILSEVEFIANRVIIINKGEIVADQPTDQLRNIAEDSIQLVLEIEEEGFKTEEIEKWEGVKRVEMLGAHSFRIQTQTDVDIRKQLFKSCVEQEKTMIGLSRETFTLEDAFRKLTS